MLETKSGMETFKLGARLSDEGRVAINRRMRHTGTRMSDSDGGLIAVGSPRRTGDNWQYAVRPAERLDAADVEIVTQPETPAESNEESEDSAQGTEA